MTALEQLGAFVVNHCPDQRALADVRLHVADSIGAWIAACGTDEGRALLAFHQPDAGLIGRVAINVALARLSEIDDIHLGSMTTPGAIVVPAALTIAASLPKADATDVAAAVIAGYEAMIRLGAAIDGPSMLGRGIWPTCFAAPFGVAAVTARLLRLGAVETAHALASALIMASPGPGQHAESTTARWLMVGHAAAGGIQAALAAQAGFTSDVKIADGDYLKSIFGIAQNTSLLSDGLGTLALNQVSFKPWWAARQTMAATQALREILADGVPAETVARIGVAVLPPHQKMIDHGVVAGDRFSHLTSLPYQMAVAALSPGAAYRLGPVQPIAPELPVFMDRIKVRPEESLLTAGYPQAWAAHVTVTTRTKRHERIVTDVPGDPARPFSEDDLKAKFVRVVAPLLDSEGAGVMFAAALGALDAPGTTLREIDRIAAQFKA